MLRDRLRLEISLVLTVAAVACSGADATSLSSTGGTASSSGDGSSGDVPPEDGGASTSSSGGGSTSSASSASSSSGGPGPSTGPNGTCAIAGQTHKTGLTSGLAHANGLKFSVYAPASYDKNVGHTVVVLMHGQDSDGVPELNALWKPLADSDQLVLVAPRGSRPSTTGNANVGNWAVADLEKVLEVMTAVDGCYNVFTKKHVLWGFSAGTFYGYLLGIAAADRFSGLAMGGANTSFARQNGYAPAQSVWKLPVSHVHGKLDQNPISLTYQDKTDFTAAGHVFTLHEHAGGHSITPDQVKMQWNDLKASSAP